VGKFKKGVGSGSRQLVVKSEQDFGVTQQVYVIASGTQWSAAILRQQEKTTSRLLHYVRNDKTKKAKRYGGIVSSGQV
jgi:hypothetical protein